MWNARHQHQHRSSENQEGEKRDWGWGKKLLKREGRGVQEWRVGWAAIVCDNGCCGQAKARDRTRNQRMKWEKIEN